MYWYNTRQGGDPNDVLLAYKVMTKRGWVTIVGYEGDRLGDFHRRGPQWPEPRERTHCFGKVPMKQRRATAFADLDENATRFHDVIPKQERGEIPNG